MSSNTLAGRWSQLKRIAGRPLGERNRTNAERLRLAPVRIMLAMIFVSSGVANAVPNQAPDAWITATAKLSLWTHSDIRSNAVKIDTSEGTVTMYGTVVSASQKKEANELILGIEGVKRVQDLLQIMTPSNTKTITVADTMIKSEVNRALKLEPTLKKSSISAQSSDKGVVLLTGTAETMSDQILAFIVTDSVDGVRHVVSEIKAPSQFMAIESKSAGELAKATKSNLITSASDMRITTEIKLRLLADENTPALSISVDTNQKRVSLFGAVASPAQSDRAKRVAQRVVGVALVQNYLQVVPETKRELAGVDDTDITNVISKFMLERPEFKNVGVSVVHGTVRLTGTVPSSWDRLHAALMSRSTPGARAVENKLNVE
jgi:hyperosmotically inducible periplasmic protein